MRRFLPLILSALVAACARPPSYPERTSPPPPPAAAAEEVDRASGFFPGAGGSVVLFEQSWRPRAAEPRAVLVVMHGGAEDAKVTLPTVPGLTAYELLWDSAFERPQPTGAPTEPSKVSVTAASLQVYRAADPT